MKHRKSLYLLSIVALTLILPAVLIFAELFFTGTALSAVVIKRWFICSAIGLRLFSAGLVQLFRPSYTLHTIFAINDANGTVLVQELGLHNVLLGAAALLTSLFPSAQHIFAMLGGLYFGVAGALHATRQNKNTHQYIAMISDFIIAAIVLLLLMGDNF